ncbi:MAG: hypothetical protein Q7S92_00215 [Candidatus Diapherotrites archaeon]|nr:hypothetical protein [Candidatus Diapherotrites archaeon]
MGFNLKEFFTGKRLLFMAVFAFIGWFALQINLFRYEGVTGKFFTWFELIGPQAGAFLGPIPGFIATFLSRVINLFVFAKPFDTMAIISLFTLALGAFYFGSAHNRQKLTGKLAILIPALCIIAFVANPIGIQVWYFALFWTLPIIAGLFFNKHLFARALGSTLTAHAVGGALWVWFVPAGQSAAFWNALIFIMPIERLMYAIGITVSFVVLNTVLSKIETVNKSTEINVNPNYVIGKTAN